MDLRSEMLIEVTLSEHDVLAVGRHRPSAGEEVAVAIGHLFRDERCAAVVRYPDEAVAVARPVVRDVDILSGG